MIRLAIFLLAWTASAAVAGTDVFQKWRTPDGTLYIGDRPPNGSVLVERIELTSRDEIDVLPATDSSTVISGAAEHGREIMRLRAAEREAERNRELERRLREESVPIVEPVPPVVFIGGGGRRHHHHHGHGHRSRLGVGPSPVSGFERPSGVLVTPNEAARRIAPTFSSPIAGIRR